METKANSNRGGYTLAQEVTGLPFGTLYSLVSQKRIPHARLSARMVIFERQALESWLGSHAVPAAGPTPKRGCPNGGGA